MGGNQGPHLSHIRTIQGNLAASGVIELKKTANIRGDIKCERLVMLEGASIEGQCQVGKEST